MDARNFDNRSGNTNRLTPTEIEQYVSRARNVHLNEDGSVTITYLSGLGVAVEKVFIRKDDWRAYQAWSQKRRE